MKNLAKALYLNILSPMEWALLIVVIAAVSLLYWDYNYEEERQYDGASELVAITDSSATNEVAVKDKSVEPSEDEDLY